MLYLRIARWIGLLIVVIGLVAPVAAAPLRNNIVNVDQSGDEADLPPDLLSEAEIERIDRLQNGVVRVGIISNISPDDGAVLVNSSNGIAFLDITTGDTVPVDTSVFEFLVPLPFLGIGEFSWQDDSTIGVLALNAFATSSEDIFAVIAINRYDGTVVAVEFIAVPDSLAPDGIISVAPNLTTWLILRDSSPENGEIAGASKSLTTRHSIRFPLPATYRLNAHRPLPAQVQKGIDRLQRQRPDLLNRLLWRQADASVLEVTNDSTDLILYDALTGDERYITSIPSASGLLRAVWTNDSTRLAASFMGTADDAQRPTFAGSLFSEEIYRDATGNLPPAQNPFIQNNNTYVVNVSSGEVQLIRPDPALGAPILEAFDWAPGGRSLLVRAHHPAYLKGRTHPLYYPQFSPRTSLRFYDQGSDGQLRLTGTFSHPMLSNPLAPFAAEFVSPDEIIVRGVIGSNAHPYYYNRVSGELRNLADRAGSYYGLVATGSSTRQIVFVYTSYTHPPDIYRLRWDGTALARLTWFNEELRREANLRQDPVTFTLRNGQVRVGTLIQSADAPFPPRNTRLIVWQQGGPGGAMTNEWSAVVEQPYALLPSFGFALLITPLAGRSGYTPEVYNSLYDSNNFGQLDIDEQAEIVQQAIARGWTSRGKIGITGCSYGGYFTLQSVIRYPDLYAAANPQCALADTISEWQSGYKTLMAYIQGLPPYKAIAEYTNDSPIFNADRIKAAVLTFHGTEDFLPIVHNENLHLQLVNRGVPARMVRFISEGHGLMMEESQLYAAQEQINWFRTHLK
ncbi:alpha/beta hydrolase family protein [Chloroflexus aurantiacus]|nr:MAG: S9 family peptidase [Chloroflexota bacterium]GIV91556.1 MAG: peptidase S9 [Chloroflexus sp.]